MEPEPVLGIAAHIR